MQYFHETEQVFNALPNNNNSHSSNIDNSSKPCASKADVDIFDPESSKNYLCPVKIRHAHNITPTPCTSTTPLTIVTAFTDDAKLNTKREKEIAGKLKDKIQWKKRRPGSFRMPSDFKGNTSLPVNILELETPYEFFRYFFDLGLVQHIAAESNQYCSQKNISKPIDIDENDILRYCGVLIYSSVMQCTSMRYYWNSV